MISPAVRYSLFQVAGGLSSELFIFFGQAARRSFFPVSALVVQVTDLVLRMSDEKQYLWK